MSLFTSTSCYSVLLISIIIHYVCVSNIMAQQYIPWSLSPTNGPVHGNAYQAIGYDEINSKIYIVGGSVSWTRANGMTRYNLNDSNFPISYYDYGNSYFIQGFEFNAQSYVQHNNILYMYPTNSQSISALTLSSSNINSLYNP